MISTNLHTLEPNWEGLLRTIGQAIVGRTSERVLEGINPDGTDYKPLSPLTIKSRRNKSRSGTKPLIDTGNLLGSINSKNMHIGLSDLTVRVGVGAEYAIYHDSLKPRKKIPYRGILDHKGLDSEEQAVIDETIEKFLETVSSDLLDGINYV